MKILSPDTFNEVKENHSGLYLMGIIFGITVFVVIILFSKTLLFLIALVIKHYYYALGIIAIFLFLKIKRRKKINKNEYPYRSV